MPEVFQEFNESLGLVLQIVAFALFGALMVETGFNSPPSRSPPSCSSPC